MFIGAYINSLPQQASLCLLRTQLSTIHDAIFKTVLFILSSVLMIIRTDSRYLDMNHEDPNISTQLPLCVAVSIFLVRTNAMSACVVSHVQSTGIGLFLCTDIKGTSDMAPTLKFLPQESLARYAIESCFARYPISGIWYVLVSRLPCKAWF